jgi:hypothetical protein
MRLSTPPLVRSSRSMTGNVPFLMKDLVLVAVSLYLLKQDVARVTQQ